jgi:hypothetical protein
MACMVVLESDEDVDSMVERCKSRRPESRSGVLAARSKVVPGADEVRGGIPN